MKLSSLKALALFLVLSSIAFSGNAQYTTVLKSGNFEKVPPFDQESRWYKSPNGKHFFYLGLTIGEDGNIVWKKEYNRSNVDYLELNDQGNLVLYARDKTVIWRSSSFETPTRGFELRLHNDGNLTINSEDNLLLWSLKNPKTGKFENDEGYIVNNPPQFLPGFRRGGIGSEDYSPEP
jgi:hypothetical protein